MKWDLTYLFEKEEDFEAGLNNLNPYIEKLKSLQGHLGEEESFVEFVEVSRDFEEALGRVYQYASLRSDLNKGEKIDCKSQCEDVLNNYEGPDDESSSYFQILGSFLTPL